jgi:uncharacterized membrane protein YeiH
MRDVLIGAVPPAAVVSWHALAISVAAGLLAFRFAKSISRLSSPVQLFDAVGLGVFAVTGTDKALDFGLTPLMAAMLGMVSGIGGGMVRDVLTAQIPMVLRSEIYAVAALTGAAVVVVGRVFELPTAISTLAAIGLCVLLRMMAIYRNWSLPLARFDGS